MKNERIQYIHMRHDVLSYASQVLGWNVYHDGDRTISLAPDSDNPTALIVHERTWHDFKTGKGGDVIDLCAWAKYGGDKGAAIRELSEGYYNPNEKTSRESWQKYTQDLCNKIQYWYEHLRKCDYDYLHSRRINDETITRLKLGYDEVEDRLIIPYFKNGYVAYYAGRDRSGKPDKSKYKKAALDGFNENIPWGLHTLTPEHRKLMHDKSVNALANIGLDLEEYLVIAEGAFDAMSFEQEGYKVLSPIGGYFNRHVNQFVIDLCKSSGIKRVFVCFDSDEAGNRFQLTMGKLLFAHRIEFVCGHLPRDIKDISDYYAGGSELSRLVKEATKGINELADKIKDAKEFKSFVSDAARFCDSTDLAVLFQQAKDSGHFSEEWLKELKKQVTQCPIESIIIKGVLAKHKLRYLERVGYYEYIKGCWREQADNFIARYFVDELGKFAAGKKFAGLHAYLRSQITTNEFFNQQNIFNFLNGILILDTGELKEHSESYSSSIQMNYNYTPGQDCPKWKSFIADVMDNDAAKMSLLQEMAGYVLFPDLRMQKCFFLMGEGGNGKSVLLNVLRRVFGEDNCSSVPISNLGSDFEPIRLLNSLVNITMETETNMKAAEARFKAIVTGDTISACYKGKDFIEFAPRAVMISACNSFINSKDTTKGFLRRIMFVNFTRTFEGKNDNKNLTNELCEELPGIFNWCYEGYKRLMKNLEFTETQEQAELMRDFTSIIDPVRAFFDDELASILEENITTQDLYKKYSDWCKESGHLALSRQKFIRQVKPIIFQKRPQSFERRGGEFTVICIRSDDNAGSN